jgi:PST family polysaccharide transporter
MIVANLGAKVVALVSSLLIVRFIAPAEYGEAIAASIVVLTAASLSAGGIGQYVISKETSREGAFHANVYQFGLAALAALVVILLRDPLARWCSAPGMQRYVPAFAVAMLAGRIGFVPERILIRQMRFRELALLRSLGEIAFGGVSVGAAIAGWGGMAIVAGNIARWLVRGGLAVIATDRRDWLTPSPLRRDHTVDIFRFAVPLMFGAIISLMAVTWDNLLVSRFFGPAVMGAYNIAFNLSGMAAAVVAEQILDILVPSFSRTDPGRRPEALLRAMAILAFVTMPLCVGTAVVAPTAVSTIFQARWASVTPMLVLLSLIAPMGPFVGLSFAYFQAGHRTRTMLALQVTTAAGILGFVALLGRLGPLWTCGAVGIGNALCCLVDVIVLRRVDRVPLGRLAMTQLLPLLSCAPMAGAVVAVRWLMRWAAFDVRFVNLAIEVLAGAAAYVVAAWFLARPLVREVAGLLRAAFLRRRAAARDAVP